MRLVLAWLIFFLLVCDALTTIVAVEKGAVETNILAQLFLNTNTLVLVKLLNGLALIYFFTRIKLNIKEEKMLISSAIAVAVFYVFVVVNNICVIISLL